MALKFDVTLQDVLDSLDRPKHYVGGMLKNMQHCAAIHGNAEVVIGTTGSGKRPYYRIIYNSSGTVANFDTFFDNHISFSKEGLPTTGGLDWSSKSTPIAEVQKIYTKIPRPAGT